jgi:hypothetical protein
MTVKELLDEYELELDDVRWYLSTYMTRRLLSYQNEPDLLTRYIWSGEMEGDFYNMEEKLIDDLQDQMDRDMTDETRLRELMNEMNFLRKKRQQKGF